MTQENEKIETNRQKKVREIKMILGDFSMWKHLLFSMSSVFIAFLMGGIINAYFPKILFVDYKVSQNELIKFPVCLIEILFVVAFIIFQRKYKYRFSTIQYYVAFYAIAVYCYMRFGAYETKLDFHNLIGQIKYFDAPFALLAMSFLFSAVRDLFKKKKEPFQNTFLEDNPLSEEKELSQFGNLVKQIEPALFEDKYDSAFSIGIIGPWGSGKSSFIKAVEKRIDSENNSNLVYISFSPFLNHNEDRVIHEFFTQLSNELKKRSGKLSNLLLNYSAKLSNAIKDGNPISFLKPSGITKEDESVGELYDEIEKVIKALNLKIIVSIDDLDRLNAKEILQVLKLIRNTSNFPNLVFLVALEKEHVINALAEGVRKYNYLDKFFQLEIHVLKNSFLSLSSFIQFSIVDYFKSEGVDNIKTLVQIRQAMELDPAYSNWIKTYRDGKRLVNQFILDYKLINTDLNTPEISVSDILDLTLIKLNSPGLLEDLRNGRYEDLHLTNSGDVLGYYFGEKSSKDDDLDIDSRTFDRSELENFNFNIKGEKIDFPHESYPITVVMILLNIFGVRRTVLDEILEFDMIQETSIRRIKNLQYYFEKTLPSEELSSSEFSKIYNSPNIVSYLDDLYHEEFERLQKFEKRVFEIVPDDSKEFKSKIRTQLLLLKYPELGENQPKANLDGTMVEYAKFDIEAFNEYFLEFAIDEALELNTKASFLLFSHKLRDFIDLTNHDLTNPISKILKYVIEEKVENKWNLICQIFKDFSDKILLDLVSMNFRYFVNNSNVEDVLNIVIHDSKELFNRYTLDPLILEIYGSIEKFRSALRSMEHDDFESQLLSKTIELLDVMECTSGHELKYVFDLNSPNYDFHDEGPKAIQLFLRIRKDAWVEMKKKLTTRNLSFEFEYIILDDNDAMEVIHIFIPNLAPMVFDSYNVFTNLIHDVSGKVLNSKAPSGVVSGLSVGNGVVVNREVLSKILSIQVYSENIVNVTNFENI